MLSGCCLRSEIDFESLGWRSRSVRFEDDVVLPVEIMACHLNSMHQKNSVRPRHNKSHPLLLQTPLLDRQLYAYEPDPAPGKSMESVRTPYVWAGKVERVGGGPWFCESTLWGEASPVSLRQRAHFLVGRNANLQSLDRLNEFFEALAAVPFYCVFANVSQADKNEDSNCASHQDTVQSASPGWPFRRESHLSLTLLTPGSE